MDNKHKEQIEALASIADFATQKDVLEKEDIRDINNRLDVILSNIHDSKKFFKRLL